MNCPRCGKKAGQMICLSCVAELQELSQTELAALKWWLYCEEHLESCIHEGCDLLREFNEFKRLHLKEACPA